MKKFTFALLAISLLVINGVVAISTVVQKQKLKKDSFLNPVALTRVSKLVLGSFDLQNNYLVPLTNYGTPQFEQEDYPFSETKEGIIRNVFPRCNLPTGN